MQRIPGVDPNTDEPYTKRAFELQTERWGAPLLNQRVYARRPALLRAARGMWAGIASSGLVDESLQALLNRRVARLNGCEF